METLNSFISTALKWAGAAGFFLLAIVLLFWPLIEGIGQLYRESFRISRARLHEAFLSIAMALSGGLIIYFDGRLDTILRKPIVTNLTIPRAIDRILESTSHIGYLRIYALTSQAIAPSFGGHQIGIDRLDL